MTKHFADPLERVIRPIVEGQIRGFVKEHPSILKGVDWYKPRQDDKAITFVNSLSKRIIRDLLCPTARARLAAALVEFDPATPSSPDRGTLAAASGACLEGALGRLPPRGWISGVAA